eukprot:TRINITY_DN29259_c0_g1_i1.p4 TRINITY_DN29259_c0_g1~~TRINITY_DN29259_c0_g1_i1.p4  ORF type:complete len:152 (+),score=7.04 TRINITY_DN29259_c0_g1_i1:2668-3123(+)
MPSGGYTHPTGQRNPRRQTNHGGMRNVGSLQLVFLPPPPNPKHRSVECPFEKVDDTCAPGGQCHPDPPLAFTSPAPGHCICRVSACRGGPRIPLPCLVCFDLLLFLRSAASLTANPREQRWLFQSGMAGLWLSPGQQSRPETSRALLFEAV